MKSLSVRRHRALDDRIDDKSTYFIPERSSSEQKSTSGAPCRAFRLLDGPIKSFMAQALAEKP